jgi:phosphoribosylformimino-5-aminoimidazole carboxamide ribonucleotide (ProFAR) isomerase
MKLFYLFISVILLSACSGPVTYTRLSNDTYEQKHADNIVVYIDEQPNKEFKKIAIISTNMWKENFATNIDRIKRKAAELGADGIIIFRADSHSSGGGMVAGPVGESFMALGAGGESGYNYSAYAIKFIGQ